jgi:hypothetical protein
VLAAALAGLLPSGATAKPVCTERRVAPPEVVAGAVLPGVDLRCMDLRGVDLSGADLSGADLTGAWLHDVDLSGADLSGARIEQAHAEGTRFVGADLTGASLHRAVLRFADMREADLTDTNLCETDLSITRNLSWATTAGTQLCHPTALPAELDDPEGEGWRYLPFRRAHAERLVTFRAFDGLGAYYFMDWGADRRDEIDVFEAGEVSVSVSLASIDIVPHPLNWGHRHVLSGVGLTTSVGIGAGSISGNRTVPIYTLSAGPFVEVFSFLTADIGGTYSVTTAPGLDWTTRDDSGFYLGSRLVIEPGVVFLSDLVRSMKRANRRRRGAAGEGAEAP